MIDETVSKYIEEEYGSHFPEGVNTKELATEIYLNTDLRHKVTITEVLESTKKWLSAKGYEPFRSIKITDMR